VEYYIIYLSGVGIQASEIFFFTAMSYFIVPIFALLSSIISVKKHKKGWYLFDIAFDMVSLSLILISGTYFTSLIFFTLIILNLRDFVYPISISYFFDCFEKDEMNDAWALHGTLSSIISLPIILLAGLFYEINPLSIFFIALFIVPIQFFLALFLLPSTTEKEEKINKVK
jgi:MFS family permease